MKYFQKCLLSFSNKKDAHGKFTLQVTFLTIMLVFSFLLTACNSSEGETSTDTDSENIEAGTEEKEEVEAAASEVQDNEEEEQNEAEEADEANDEINYSELINCEGILFSSFEEIEGSALADCIVEAMVSQHTGTHIVKDDTGQNNTVDFRWDPHFSMHVDDGDVAAIVKGDTGWFKMGGAWIQEDPNSTDPEVMMATTMINLYRGFGDPRFIAEYLGKVSTWTVAGKETVPDSDAFVDRAWKLTTDDVIDMELAIVSDLEFWITDNYLSAYHVATGTTGDISVTTSNTFTQWGGEVNIPEPE